MKKLVSAAILLSLLLLMFTSCGIKPQQMTKTYYEYFNTVSSVSSFAGDSEENFAAVSDKVDAMLREYHNLYDIYYEYSGVTNLKTVNECAADGPVQVDRKIIDLLLFGKEMYELTSGEVNIAMGAVLSLWHNARVGESDGTHTLPTDAELESAASHTDINSLVIDEVANTVFFADPEMSLDVGAIAKGYATERIAEALLADSSLNVEGYALNIGGNIRLLGEKGGGDWRIGITHPIEGSENPYIAIVNVKDCSVVTSGDYERFFTVDGKNYHHIIDKDTLYPSTYFHSVTVIAKSSAVADALTTALFSMHVNDGYRLVERLDGVEALWIGTNKTFTASEGFPLVEKFPVK